MEKWRREVRCATKPGLFTNGTTSGGELESVLESAHLRKGKDDLRGTSGRLRKVGERGGRGTKVDGRRTRGNSYVQIFR